MPIDLEAIEAQLHNGSSFDGYGYATLHDKACELLAEAKRLRALKLPASQQMHNITKALYEDALAEISELRAAIERKNSALKDTKAFMEYDMESTGTHPTWHEDAQKIVDVMTTALEADKEPS